MAVTSVGQIGLDLVVNQNQFNRQMTGIQSLAVKVGKTLAVAFGVKKLVQFSKECINLGSDLQEVQNVVNVTFPKMASQVNNFAKEAAASFGLSETMAKKFTGTFGSMSKAFGFSEEQAYEMGTALTGLAGDVASFYNITQDEAYTKLKSVFTGETESLKDLGVVMTQTALDSYALANGFSKTTKSMSEAEKVALRYAFVQDQLSAATGDFIRTSDGWANQVRVLKLRFDSLKATLGQGFINLFTPIVQMINTTIGKLSSLAEAFRSFTELITGNQSSDSQLSNAIIDADTLTESVSGVGEAAKQSAKEMRGLRAFDELNVISSTTTSGSGSGTGTTGSSSSKTEASTGGSLAIPMLDTINNINFEPLKASFNNLKEEIMPIVQIIGDGLQWFMDNILAPLGEWVIEEALPSFFDVLAGAFTILEPLLLSLQPPLQWLWDNFLSPIASWTGDAITTTLDTLAGLLEDIGNWMTENQSVVDAMTVSVTSFFAAWKVVELLAFIQQSGGVIAALNLMTGAVWKNIAAKIADKAETIALTLMYAKDFIVSLATGTAALVKQAVQWGINTAAKIADTAATIASTVATTAATAATWAFNAALAVLTSPITLVVVAIAGLVAGIVLLVKNFDTVKEVAINVFDAIWKFIKGIINAILGGIESMVNGIIKGLNSMINALNKLKFKVPDWVPALGGKELGFSIKKVSEVKLPRLAEGGYVKANTPQLAIIGDNKHQGEVVAPESKLEQMALKAASLVNEKNSSLNDVYLKQIIELLMAILEKDISISGDDIFNSVRKTANAYTQRTGNPAFNY